jgi:AP-2 complex subunit mu-1
MVFQYLFQFRDILKSYLGEKFDEVLPVCDPPPARLTAHWPHLQEAIKNNFTLVYELLDGTAHCNFTSIMSKILTPHVTECMDSGYPQNCAIDVLKLYINLGSQKVHPCRRPTAPPNCC